MPGVEEASANVATPHETAPLSTNSIDSIDTINTMDNISTINDVSNGINTGEEKRGCACVTGAGGFIATWLVKTLLDKGYTVKGTLRNPDDEKNAHLMTLERAKERLTLVKADLEDRASITKAFKGCDAVFHLASPVTDNPIQMVDPALNGMLNVLNACVENGVKRIVFTSSIGSIYMDPQRDPSVIVDESCWSSLEYCKDTKNWYCYGKTLAEKTAWEYAKKIGVDLVVLAPSVVLGPLLQPTINASTMHLLKFVNGSTKRYTNHVQAYVDVRDVALACILLYETPSASGRYLCAENILHRGEVAEILINFFPQFPIPTKCSDEKNPRAKPYQFSNMKLRNLGFNFTPIKQCLYDTIISLKHKGIIQEPLPVEMANLDSPS